MAYHRHSAQSDPIEAAPVVFLHAPHTPGAGLHPAPAGARRLHADGHCRWAFKTARAGHRAASSGSGCAATRSS